MNFRIIITSIVLSTIFFSTIAQNNENQLLNWKIGVEGSAFVMPNMISAYAAGVFDPPGLALNFTFSRRVSEKIWIHSEIGVLYKTFYSFTYDPFPQKKYYSSSTLNFVNFLPFYLQYEFFKRKDNIYFFRGGLRKDNSYAFTYQPVFTSILIGCKHKKFLFSFNYMHKFLDILNSRKIITTTGNDREHYPVFKKPSNTFRNYWGFTIGYYFLER